MIQLSGRAPLRSLSTRGSGNRPWPAIPSLPPLSLSLLVYGIDSSTKIRLSLFTSYFSPPTLFSAYNTSSSTLTFDFAHYPTIYSIDTIMAIAYLSSLCFFLSLTPVKRLCLLIHYFCYHWRRKNLKFVDSTCPVSPPVNTDYSHQLWVHGPECWACACIIVDVVFQSLWVLNLLACTSLRTPLTLCVCGELTVIYKSFVPNAKFVKRWMMQSLHYCEPF